MRRVARFLGRTIGLLVVWGIAAALTIAAADPFVARDTAAYLGWGVGVLAVAWFWRTWRRRGREIAIEEQEAELAAGDALRREDLPRYRALLADAGDPLAFTDPDRYVGRLLTAPKPPQRFRWESPTAAQRSAVERLTDELQNATLVRTVDDGIAEVLGVKDDVGYRYRVDAEGNAALFSTDDTQVQMLRSIRRVALTGIALFVGPFVPLLIWHRDGSVPGWLVPFMIVGFVLAFFGIAASGGPKHFLDPGERWQEHGSGWD